MNACARELRFMLSSFHSKLTRVASKWALPALLCALLHALAIPASGAPPVSRYDQVMHLVRALSDSPNVRLLPFGKSFTQGYCVPVMLITDFSVKSENKTRIFVCTGQHGNEFDAVRSILSLSCNLSSGTEPDILKKCEFVVVPMVNPTGVDAHTRLSADNIDLNRNWRTPFSPEALHVSMLINTWRPHLLIDAHEQDKPSNLEVPYCLSTDQQTAMNKLAQVISAKNNLPIARSGSNKSLFHNNYAFLGYGAYLIEVDKNLDYATKYKIYTGVILGMAKALSDNTIPRSTLSPLSNNFSVAAVAPYLKPLTPKEPHAVASLFNTGLLLVFGYILCIWLLKPTFHEKKTQWSRMFIRCEVDQSIFANRLVMKQTLIPITSRSWVRRQLRSCYAAPKPEGEKYESQPIDSTLTFIKPKYAKAGGERPSSSQIAEVS